MTIKQANLMATLLLLPLMVGYATKGEWIQLFDGESLDGWLPKITGYELPTRIPAMLRSA